MASYNIRERFSGGENMHIELTNEEVEVLADILDHELNRLEIETLRTDSIAYHQLMQKKTKAVDSIVNKLKVGQKI